jgi:DNA-directed RNA polymerase specialized sigma24 family protein
MSEQNTTAELMRLATEAAEWVDQVKEPGGADIHALTEWLRLSPTHFEEFLCACAIDMAICSLQDKTRVISILKHVAEIHERSADTPSASPGRSLPPYDRISESAVATIRRTALTFTTDKGAAEVIVQAATMRLCQCAHKQDSQMTLEERELIGVALGVSRMWLKKHTADDFDEESFIRHAKIDGEVRPQSPSHPPRALAILTRVFSPLESRCAEAFIRVRWWGHSVDVTALAMETDRRTVKDHMQRVYLHFMDRLEKTHRFQSARDRLTGVLRRIARPWRLAGR